MHGDLQAPPRRPQAPPLVCFPGQSSSGTLGGMGLMSAASGGSFGVTTSANQPAPAQTPSPPPPSIAPQPSSDGEDSVGVGPSSSALSAASGSAGPNLRSLDRSEAEAAQNHVLSQLDAPTPPWVSTPLRAAVSDVLQSGQLQGGRTRRKERDDCRRGAEVARCSGTLGPGPAGRTPATASKPAGRSQRCRGGVSTRG